MRINGKIMSVLLICLAFVSLVAEPKQNGFHCDDPSIREPFIKLQISLTKLLSFSILIPIIVIILAESVYKTSTQISFKEVIHQNIRIFMFGVMTNFLAVMSAKNLFGRLRPHAIHFCNASHYCPEGLNDKYIENFECHNTEVSVHMLRNVRHSFYSGHASIAVFSGVFLILYLRSKLRSKSKLLKLLSTIVYMTIAIISLYPGFTQWHNSWHFASDVLTGYAIGLLSSILIFKLFSSDTTKEQNNTNNYMPLNRLLTTA